jgi:glycine/D-amino acid oxidase-like deaminating enzyme
MRLPMRTDVLVVGGGIIGASILRRLAEAGLRAMLIEGRRMGAGATGYSGAMVRVTHPTIDEVTAAGEGLAAYRLFPEESAGRVGLRESGHLYFGAANILESMLSEVSALSPSAQILTCDEISSRWPGLEVTAEAAIYEPHAGYANAIAFVRHQINMAVNAGAQVAEATLLTRIFCGDGQIKGAQTSLGRIETRAVVLATGPETSGLLKGLGILLDEIWSQKIQVSRFEIDDEVDSWPGFVADAQSLNGVPSPWRGTYHIGLPTGFHVTPGDERSHEATPEHATETRNAARALIPRAAKARFSGAMCHTDCYSTAPIGVIGPRSGLPDGLLLATGFSGGGFKMAPYTARCIYEFLA